MSTLGWGSGAAPSAAQLVAGGPSRWWKSEAVRQELKLTSEQSAQIEQIFQSSTERLRTDKEELDRARSVLSQLMAKSEVDEGEITRVIDRVELARYAMSKERTLMLVRIHRVLTPDQRKALESLHRRGKRDRDRTR